MREWRAGRGRVAIVIYEHCDQLIFCWRYLTAPQCTYQTNGRDPRRRTQPRPTNFIYSCLSDIKTLYLPGGYNFYYCCRYFGLGLADKNGTTVAGGSKELFTRLLKWRESARLLLFFTSLINIANDRLRCVTLFLALAAGVFAIKAWGCVLCI